MENQEKDPLLVEMEKANKTLRRIANWIALFGILALLSMGLAFCSALT